MVKYNKTANASERLSFMVTEKEMAERNFSVSGDERKASYHVTADEMKRFAVNADLNNKVYKKIDDYTKKHNIKPKYDGLEEICQLSASALKKSCSGSIRITRLFLYKLTVGLKMDVDEANELFALCGGELDENFHEDYVCYKALKDKDDIIHFIDQFNHYAREYDSHQEGDKLKKFE
jgi:hypothetical protein